MAALLRAYGPATGTAVGVGSRSAVAVGVAVVLAVVAGPRLCAHGRNRFRLDRSPGELSTDPSNRSGLGRLIARLGPMDPFATADDGLYRRAEFIRAGRNDRSLRRAVTRGELARVAPGVFIESSVWGAADHVEKHVLRARASAPRLGEAAVFSHATAVALHGWSTLATPGDHLDVTRADVTRGWLGAVSRIHAAPLAGSDVVVVRGLPTTAAGRTAVDVTATSSFREAVVLLDSALRAASDRADPLRGGRDAVGTPLQIAQFDEAFERRLPVRGAAHVARVRAFADGAAGSVGESLSRCIMHERTWPAPVLQQRFVTGGSAIGDVDFWWGEFGVIGEFDGYVKYSRGEYLRGATPADAVFAEKRREDRLRAHPAVRGFARWTWADLMQPTRLEAILRAASLPI